MLAELRVLVVAGAAAFPAFHHLPVAYHHAAQFSRKDSGGNRNDPVADDHNDGRQGLPESINFPRIIKIDFKKKTIIDDQFGQSIRTTMIDKLQEIDGKLVLNGTQEGMGWTVVINQSNGDLTLSATDDQFGFIVFGACTPK